MKWDKWGNSYRIKKGDQVVSLSDLQGSTLCVGKPYSTVMDWNRKGVIVYLLEYLILRTRHF